MSKLKTKKIVYVVYSRLIGNITYLPTAYETLEKANKSLLLMQHINKNDNYGIAEWELR